MEFSLRIVVVLVLLLVAALIFATLIMGWGKDALGWSEAVMGPMRELILGK